MRPEKARQIINNNIKKYMRGVHSAMYGDTMLRALYKMLVRQLIWHEEHGYDLGDYEPDIDTDYESIHNEMEYISDRWDASHRIKWLIVGIETNKF